MEFKVVPYSNSIILFTVMMSTLYIHINRLFVQNCIRETTVTKKSIIILLLCKQIITITYTLVCTANVRQCIMYLGANCQKKKKILCLPKKIILFVSYKL